MFKKLFIGDNCFETVLMYDDFLNKFILFGYYKAIFISK